MNRQYRFLHLVVRSLFSLFHPAKTIGREKLPEGGCLICGNHTRNSDPLFLIFALGRFTPLRIMAKEEIRRWFLVGGILDRLDLLIWVRRGEADVRAVKESLKAVKSGKKLMMFPEGTRNEEVGDGKTGAAMLAIRGGVPILPVYIPAKKRWFAPTPVIFGEPYLPFAEDRKPTQEDYRRVTDDLMGRIAALGAGLHGASAAEGENVVQTLPEASPEKTGGTGERVS